MTLAELTQDEADELLDMEKHSVDDSPWELPELGKGINIPLVSHDKKEDFLLDIYQGRINISRGNYQNRARKIVVLARLDFGTQPHRNPDGQVIPAPHIHIYREGYGDKWAYPLSSDKFSDPSDFMRLLNDFMKFCNITKPPYL